MFLKLKRTGDIKGRGYADGRSQRNYMTKEETSSPTVSIQGLMTKEETSSPNVSIQGLILLCMINAKKGRDVATADIPGAFLQTDYDEGGTHLRIERTMAEMLAQNDPKLYRRYITTTHNGKKVLYAETMKAIYGTLNASLLFWIKLSYSLTKMGFTFNPYDRCCMNKQIDGSQCTILWHVDDIKVSHVDPTAVTTVLALINEEYGKETPLTVTRGQVHHYLGMTIDFSMPGRVQFTMIEYITDTLDNLPEDMQGEAATPAGKHLFKVDKDTPTLFNDDDATMFHHNTAKLLFAAKRARPDLQLAVAFLCTRMRAPDTNDYKKLGRLMKYIWATIGLPLILAMDKSGKIRWYIAVAFAVHNDMKSHTGAMMMMGQGAASAQSSKKQLNTKSSIESELMGVDDNISQVIWCRYFLEAQDEAIDNNIVYQDNQSSMKLEKNGMKSSDKRTRHINIRYFFVINRIAAGELNVEYCPTLDMIGDYFTKPLQGSLFRNFRNTILGVNEADIPTYNAKARAMLKKRRAVALLASQKLDEATLLANRLG
jgi:hypothetical protein